MPILRCLIFALLVTLAVSRPALAADGPGTATVRKANATLTALLRRHPPAGSTEEQQLAGEVTASLQGFLDVEELGRRALTDHWATLAVAERAEFAKLLRELVQSSYLSALRSQLEYQVAYLSEKPNDAGLLVTTEVRLLRKDGRQSVGVDYLLRREGDRWRVYDLVTDGVGMVENYRAQFNKIIAKEGVSGLLARMRKKKQN